VYLRLVQIFLVVNILLYYFSRFIFGLVMIFFTFEKQYFRYVDNDDDDGLAALLDVRSVELMSSVNDAYWAGACSNVEYLVEHFYLTCDYPKYDPVGGGTGRDISVVVTIDGQTGTLFEGFSYIDDSG